MTQKIKKIIAREVIIFTIYLLVTSGTLFVIWLNNYNKSKLKDEFIEVRNKLYDQQFAIVDKVKHQNEGDLRAFIKPKRRIPSLEELEGKPKFDPNKPYESLPDLDTVRIQRESMYDKISERYDIGTLYEFMYKITIPEKRLILYNKLVSDGYSIGTFDQFEKKLGYAATGTMKNRTIMAFLNRWIDIYDKSISEINVKSSTEVNHLFVQLIFIFLLVFYPLRFLVMAIIWALKTLRAK